VPGDDRGPVLAGLPLVAVDIGACAGVPAGLLGLFHWWHGEPAVLVEAERHQRRGDVELRDGDGDRVRLVVERRVVGRHRRGSARGVGDELGAAPRECECGTEHEDEQSHAGPTPVLTPPDGRATRPLTTSPESAKSLLLSAAVSWPGSHAIRSLSASRPCGSSFGVSLRICCAVRPSASGKSLQSRSTKFGSGSGSSDGSGSSVGVGVGVGDGVGPGSASSHAVFCEAARSARLTACRASEACWCSLIASRRALTMSISRFSCSTRSVWSAPCAWSRSRRKNEIALSTSLAFTVLT